MKTLGWLTVLAGALIVLLGLFVLVATVVVWLKAATWSPLGLNALWGGGELATGWVGLDWLTKTFHDFPVGMLIMFAGLGVGYVGICLLDWPDRIEAQRWRRRLAGDR